MAVAGECDTADDGGRVAGSGQEPADVVDLAVEVHAWILSRPPYNPSAADPRQTNRGP